MSFDIRTVSRETSERLAAFSALVEKWTPRINLVSRSTVSDLWQRHIVDSAQIYDYCPKETQDWVDLGSGGGFPGIVIAILAAEFGNPQKTILVESDARKSAFLRTAIRELSLNAQVITERIEEVPPLRADVLSARALADLETLLGFAARHLNKDGVALFLKGENWRKELDQAQKAWSFSCEVSTSLTAAESVILKISGVARV